MDGLSNHCHNKYRTTVTVSNRLFKKPNQLTMNDPDRYIVYFTTVVDQRAACKHRTSTIFTPELLSHPIGTNISKLGHLGTIKFCCWQGYIGVEDLGSVCLR